MMEGQFDWNELDKLLRKEAVAIERWFQQYVDTVFTFIYYKVGRDMELVADIVQDTFLEGLSKLNRYDSKKGSMSSWLVFLSRNHIKKALRAKKRFLSSPGVIRLNSELFDYCNKLTSQEIPEEIIQRKEIAELVQVTLVDIPVRHREILKLYYFYGKSLRQIAEFCKISEGAAKVLLHRARKSFEKAFTKSSGDSDYARRKEG